MALFMCRNPFEYAPSRVFDQHFDLGLEPEDLLINNLLMNYYCPYENLRNSKQPGSESTINVDEDKFQANLDVQQFRPEEITVKVTGDNTVTVEGKHEEKQDVHGFISRHFIRKYVIPEGHNVDKIESKLSSDGVLTITAPKLDSKAEEHRSIPITKTGKPSKAVEEKQKKEEEE